MDARRVVAAIAAVSVIVSGFGWVGRSDAQPEAPPVSGSQAPDVTPSRVSYIHGDVSFWRPGAQDWAPARSNTALAPGDQLYTGPNGNVEIQIGPRAFVRAAEGTQLGLDNQDPQFVQVRVTAGHAALDARDLPAGQVVEFSTPNAAFTIEHAGYYRLDIVGDSVSFATHRGGRAVVTPEDGPARFIDPGRQVVFTGSESTQFDIREAPALTAWDSWNDQRSAYLVQSTSTHYVPEGVYGVSELETYGTWRQVDTYGPVWVPRGVAVGWSPYSTGRWIWDPIYGWTWLDDAPWGWAPYHYGRWVFVNNYWAWAPGPVRIRPVYSPALVVFLGGVSVSFGRPLAWAPLAWGEPVIPWWGRPGFVGVPSWRGWGGPRVVNNVVVNNVTNVNVQNINVYRNVNTVNAVVGVPADRFGRERVTPTRLSQTDVQRLAPVRGRLAVQPVSASLVPATGPAPKPPAAVEERRTVATRPPRDVTQELRAHGLGEGARAARPATPRLVTPPRSARTSDGVRDGDRPPTPATAPSSPAQSRRAQPSDSPREVRPAPGAPSAPGRVERPDVARPQAPADRVDRPGRPDAPARDERATPPPPGPGRSRETAAPPASRPEPPPARVEQSDRVRPQIPPGRAERPEPARPETPSGRAERPEPARPQTAPGRMERSEPARPEVPPGRMDRPEPPARPQTPPGRVERPEPPRPPTPPARVERAEPPRPPTPPARVERAEPPARPQTPPARVEPSTRGDRSGRGESFGNASPLSGPPPQVRREPPVPAAGRPQGPPPSIERPAPPTPPSGQGERPDRSQGPARGDRPGRGGPDR
jgi:uncharacterized protein DUF6600